MQKDEKRACLQTVSLSIFFRQRRMAHSPHAKESHAITLFFLSFFLSFCVLCIVYYVTQPIEIITAKRND